MIIKGKMRGWERERVRARDDAEMGQKGYKVSDYFFSSRVTFIIDTSFEK